MQVCGLNEHGYEWELEESLETYMREATLLLNVKVPVTVWFCAKFQHCDYLQHDTVSSTLAGLCNKRLGRSADALDSFYKLHAILRNNAQVIYQIADLYPCKLCSLYDAYFRAISNPIEVVVKYFNENLNET